MPVHFRRLRIAGFKSFAEPVSVEIHPGLTGIVGPNGCGKSNVVEALRWAMGEQSTRSLRAGEMDDVIFAGTAGRPSRNIAEVTITLDETEGAAPPPFHEQPELEIIRRIERGAGSEYRVNGKEVRARDVQTLFADLASGAHASGMVSQGRVGALVTARPEDRRAVIEEAAGITGLHARRHEAELKLRAAEANMARAEDLRGQLEVAACGAEAAGAAGQPLPQHLRRHPAGRGGAVVDPARPCGAVRGEAQAALHAARLAVAAATEAATQAAIQATEAAAALPALRSSRIGCPHQSGAPSRGAGADRRRGGARPRRPGWTQPGGSASCGQDLSHAEQLSRDSDAAEQRLACRGFGNWPRPMPGMPRVPVRPRRLRRAQPKRCARRRRKPIVRPKRPPKRMRARRPLPSCSRRQSSAGGAWTSSSPRSREERDRIRSQAIEPASVEAASAEQAAGRGGLAEARAAQDAAEQARAAAMQALAARAGEAVGCRFDARQAGGRRAMRWPRCWR